MMTDAYAEWTALVASARLGVAPAELHGSVTGYVCAGWSGQVRELVAALELEGDGGTPAAGGALETLLAAAATRAVQCLRTGKPVELLLPLGPLAARANALVDWCRGFLGGLGLTGVLDELDGSPNVHDVLAGLGHVAAMHLECGDDDEAMLDDVLDFVRRGVGELGAALAPRGRG